MPDGGEHLDHAHRPGAVTGVGDGRTFGSRTLGADDRRQGVAAVAEAHRSEEAAGTFETQVAVGDGVDVADVGGDHDVGGHRLLELAQHLARVQPVAVLLLGLVDGVEGELVLLMGPGIELGLPRILLCFDEFGTLVLRGVAGDRAVVETGEEILGDGLGVTADADVDLLDQAEHLLIGVDLDDLRVGGPVVEFVLRQCAERSQTGAQREDDIGLVDQRHPGLRALVPQRSGPQGVAGGEGVVVLVAVDHG